MAVSHQEPLGLARFNLLTISHHRHHQPQTPPHNLTHGLPRWPPPAARSEPTPLLAVVVDPVELVLAAVAVSRAWPFERRNPRYRRLGCCGRIDGES